MEKKFEKLTERINETVAIMKFPRTEGSDDIGFPDIETIIFGNEETLAQFSGIESEVFPSHEELTEEQMEKLSDGIIRLFEKINVGVFVPEGIPVSMKYRMLVRKIDEKLPIWAVLGYEIEVCCEGCDECEALQYCKTGQMVISSIPDFDD